MKQVVSSIPVPIPDLPWLTACVEKLTDEIINLKVSEWAAKKRYLPKELTSKPGFWNNNYTPFLVEPMDCLSKRSPVRKVAFMKPTQIGATTGLGENFIGYTIDHDPSGMMYVSADKELTQTSIEVKLDRMLLSSGLSGKLGVSNPKSRKSGDTSSKKEFPGGFLLAVGAQNPGKLRSMSVEKLYMDEIDGMPERLGNEGNPIDIAENRTKAFEKTRKILYTSTPTIMQSSHIYAMFLLGDQRYFYVPCLHCKEMQVLKWQGTTEAGDVYGIDFELDEEGFLIESSVQYICKYCGGAMHDYDKPRILQQGEWRPSARPHEPTFRSYHLNALYSPPGMYSWTSMVYKWIKAWNVEENRVRNLERYKTFVNLDLGWPWEERGESPKYETVIQHRRQIYTRNAIPNQKAVEETGGPVYLLTASVDVHGDWLGMEIVGWCAQGRSYSVDYRRFDGDTTVLQGLKSPWNAVRTAIETEVWIADDSRKYQIQITNIDASYRTDAVYSFCSEYCHGVYPVMGRDTKPKHARLQQFDEYQNKLGCQAFNVTVTLYKDRLASWLRADWNYGEQQPLGYPNYPCDYGDEYFRQYGAETKVRLLNKITGLPAGYFWKKDPNIDNHAWDMRVYNMAALDMLILSDNLRLNEIEEIDYAWFWAWMAKEQPYCFI